MQQACFPSGWMIDWMVYIFCLALASAALLGVGRQGGLSSPFFLPLLARLAYALIGVLEVVSPLDFFSVTYILSDRSHVAL